MRTNAVETAYAALRRAILDGGYAPGAQLGEVELAESLGVSRTPVREALRRLGSEGLIEVIPNRGAYVRIWDAAELYDLFSVRALLEGHAAELAADRVSREQLSAMQTLCDEMEAAAEPGPDQDMERLATFNDRFHHAVHEASGSKLLPGMIRGLVQVPIVVRTFRSYSPQRLDQSMQQHRSILAALTAGDAAWAEAAMKSHVLSARLSLAAVSPATPE
jgi:DNA-binding GntR family transcriptional regulator